MRARFIRSLKYPEWKATAGEVWEMLGLAPKQKLPREGMPGRYVQEIWVWVEPLAREACGSVGLTRLRVHRRAFHRVRCACPRCGQHMSVGRLHQHVCSDLRRKSPGIIETTPAQHAARWSAT